MFWLTSISNWIAALAWAVALVPVVRWVRRQPGRAVLRWQIQVLASLLMVATALVAAAVQFATGWPHDALLFGAPAVSLTAAVMVWPVLRQMGAGPFAALQAQSRAELARAEATESRHWLLLAEKIARVGHWRYRLEDGKMEWSEEVFSILNLPPGSCEPSLERFLSRVAPEDRERARDDIATALEKGGPFEHTVSILAEGPSHGHITARGIPELDPAGKMRALFGVIVDITAQKRIEQDLKTAHQASENANRALENLARHDALTRLANRRHFDDAIATEFRRAARDSQPIGLIMVDLDHFKAYNDQYGHPAGDNCLRLVSEAVASVPQRPADLVARYGGEELVVLLPNTDLAGTETVADMLVQAVRKLHIPHAGNPAKIVTISCGAAIFEPESDPHVPVMLIERADQALYTAKRGGRNRAVSRAIAA
jgi:diguanylate cyclase (GGDEF)-like protein